jgi:NAD(P)-dependent dehydrogenase (short-subunit alcohol dehydrogenase family)
VRLKVISFVACFVAEFQTFRRRCVLAPKEQRVMLITGGSRGIGAATAQLAAQRGYAVVISYAHNAQAAQQLAQDISHSGGQVLALQADVAQEAQVLAMFATVAQRFGALHALVNNAGIVDVPCKVQDMSTARLVRMFNTNILGSFICAREALKLMPYGSAIVNVGSAAARIGSPNQYVDYAASKGAIDTFTLGLAKEVAARGIRVNAVRPGIIDTDIHASGGLPTRAQDLAPQLPLQRAGTAQEVAKAILWLCSDEASYTTGSILDVAGGR